MPNPLTTTLGALALGVGAGLFGGWLAFGGHRAGDLSLGEADGLGPTPAAESPRPGIGASAATAPVAPVLAPAEGFKSVAEALDALAATPGAGTTAAAAEPAGPGDLTIAGRVTRDDGAGLEGVAIRAERVQTDPGRPKWRRGDGVPAEDDLETHVRGEVRGHRERTASRVTGVTGADGRFTLPGLRKGAYLVAGFKEGWHVGQPGQQQAQWFGRRSFGWSGVQAASASGYPVNVAAGGTVDLLAQPVAAVTVRLEQPDGSAPKRAYLTIAATGSGETQPWFPDEPTLRLTPGTYRLTASVSPQQGNQWDADPDAEEFTSDEVVLEVVAGRTPDPVTIRLKDRRGIKGTLVGFQADPMRYAMIWALRVDDGAPQDLEKIKQSQHRAWVRGGSTTFVFRDLPAGRYLVGAAHDWQGEIVASATVTVGESMATVELTLPPPAEMATLVVRAIGPDGTPVGDVQFWVEKSAQGWIQPTRRERTDDGGHQLSFPAKTFEIAAQGDQPAKPAKLHANAKAYGAASVEVATGQTAVTVSFKVPATLEVTVANAKAYEGKLSVSVTLAPAEGEGGGEQWQQTFVGGGNMVSYRSSGMGGGAVSVDAEGRARWGPGAPGDYLVTLHVQTENGSSVAAKQRQALQSGPNTVALAVPALYTMVVDFGKGTGAEGEQRWASLGAVQEGKPEDEWDDGNWIQIQANGEAKFEQLAAGTYRVQHWTADGEQVSMTVRVPAQSRVTFTPDAQDAMQVSVADEAKALGKAGFKSGDLVVAVNGKGFASRAAFAALVTAGAAAGTVTLGVEREGKPLALALDAPALVSGLMGGNELGGALSPTSRKR